MAWLYLAPDLPADVGVGDRVALSGDEARHAAQVARVRAGERISVGDGRGRIVTGSVVEASPASVSVDVDEIREEPPATPAIWLAQALAKGDRDELAIQAATELGVSGVIPWSAERSVSRWEGAKVAKGESRWRAITAEAAKQSIRAWAPEVAPLSTTRQLAARAGSDLLLVLDPEAEERLTETALDAAVITIVVGPEGGISASELAHFEGQGARRVRLGSEVLRTSTAGPAALAVLNARLGRW